DLRARGHLVLRQPTAVANAGDCGTDLIREPPAPAACFREICANVHRCARGERQGMSSWTERTSVESFLPILQPPSPAGQPLPLLRLTARQRRGGFRRTIEGRTAVKSRLT